MLLARARTKRSSQLWILLRKIKIIDVAMQFHFHRYTLFWVYVQLAVMCLSKLSYYYNCCDLGIVLVLKIILKYFTFHCRK